MRFGDRSRAVFGRRALCVAVLMGGTALSAAAWAEPVAAPQLPTGPVVTAGQAGIVTSGATLTVTQPSARAIIDWNAFSIGAGGTVVVQNGAGATLNRVTGTQASGIDGTLSATGSVYLINPNGVVIGRSGVVDVGGTFVASTLDIADGAFLGDGAKTFAGTSSATVVNLGKIGALGGDVALIAATVSNAGTIAAPGGAAGLLAGSRVVMTDASLDGGRFAVALPASGASVTNSGLIAAATAELRANGGDIYALAGDTAGVVRATGVAAGGGRIWLVADGGTAHVAGTLDAQGAGGAAGAVETSGATVDIEPATIDAHGGTWTLDPTNIEITPTAATVIGAVLAGNDVTELTNATGTTESIGGSPTVKTTGAGDITLDAGAAISWSSARTLTLSAYHDITIAGTINASGAGVLTLRAGTSANGTGTINISGTAPRITLGTGASANLYYNPASYTDAATTSTVVTDRFGTSTFTNPYLGQISGGTTRAYMLVNNLAQLQSITGQLAGLYALDADIDAAATATLNPLSSGGYAGFLPIGYVAATGTTDATTNVFTGRFDGQNHIVSNLYINHSGDDAACSATSPSPRR